MWRVIRCGLFAVFCSYFTYQNAYACSTFAIPASQEKIFGKSYDWGSGHGLVLINKRNVKKRALQLDFEFPAAEWISRLGSVTFTQFGQELPLGGMNEKGLTVEIMLLGQSRYPDDPSQETLNELQWIQYILDTSETIDEAIANARAVQIRSEAADVHYLACDRFGDCATFEYLLGELEVHTGPSLVAPVLTNSTYRQSATYLQRFEGFGGNERIPDDAGSLSRFVIAAHYSKKYPLHRGDLSAKEYGFFALDKLRWGATQWQIVYESMQGKIWFRNEQFPVAQLLDLNDVDFDCHNSINAIDVTGEIYEEASWTWQEFDRDRNRKLLEIGLESVGYPRSDRLLDYLASYPESNECLSTL